jgi:hypothetical protein
VNRPEPDWLKRLPRPHGKPTSTFDCASSEIKHYHQLSLNYDICYRPQQGHGQDKMQHRVYRGTSASASGMQVMVHGRF